MIYKKGDEEKVKNYGPIALVNCLTKLFTAILKSRLEKWLNDKEILVKEQLGFRKKRGRRDNVFYISVF